MRATALAREDDGVAHLELVAPELPARLRLRAGWLRARRLRAEAVQQAIEEAAG